MPRPCAQMPYSGTNSSHPELHGLFITPSHLPCSSWAIRWWPQSLHFVLKSALSLSRGIPDLRTSSKTSSYSDMADNGPLADLNLPISRAGNLEMQWRRKRTMAGRLLFLCSCTGIELSTAVGVCGYLLYLGEWFLALISAAVFAKLIVFHVIVNHYDKRGIKSTRAAPDGRIMHLVRPRCACTVQETARNIRPPRQVAVPA
ncbi:hypothetical protein CENSYa_0277 [Cenarchaeum symbiosum A]|uniref:Uncharacterized protein n=1 Tax=Cenarchaeum symbiosum (strain A) TaxID=414004 RepID=A0RUA0_CENSY|nr:hypothetical protein CENSYa_0277 [Cenarchaeum symbiosum A]